MYSIQSNIMKSIENENQPKLLLDLDPEKINEIDLSNMEKYIEWTGESKKYLNLNAGQEHYKLIAYIVKNYLRSDEYAVDIGTYMGLSALAMSKYICTVYTYDIKDHIPDDKSSIKDLPEIIFKVKDCTFDEEILLNSKLILLDIDHDGEEEERILDFLRCNDYKGIVILDDIHIFKPMKDLWDNIPEKKYDITDIGHWSGTGIVFFDEKKIDII